MLINFWNLTYRAFSVWLKGNRAYAGSALRWTIDGIVHELRLNVQVSIGPKMVEDKLPTSASSSTVRGTPQRPGGTAKKSSLSRPVGRKGTPRKHTS